MAGKARTRKEFPGAWPGQFPSWQSHPLSLLPQGLDTRGSQILFWACNPTLYPQAHQSVSSEGPTLWRIVELFPRPLGLTCTPDEIERRASNPRGLSLSHTPGARVSSNPWRLSLAGAGKGPLSSLTPNCLAPYLPTLGSSPPLSPHPLPLAHPKSKVVFAEGSLRRGPEQGPSMTAAA